MPNLEERVVARLTAQGRSPVPKLTIGAGGRSPPTNTTISTLPIQARSRTNHATKVVAAALAVVFATIVCGWLARIEARLLSLEATLASTSDQVASLLASPSSNPLPIVLVAPPPPTPAPESLPLSLSFQALTPPKLHVPKRP
jgi:hypothetical protein